MCSGARAIVRGIARPSGDLAVKREDFSSSACGYRYGTLGLLTDPVPDYRSFISVTAAGRLFPGIDLSSIQDPRRSDSTPESRPLHSFSSSPVPGEHSDFYQTKQLLFAAGVTRLEGLRRQERQNCLSVVQTNCRGGAHRKGGSFTSSRTVKKTETSIVLEGTKCSGRAGSGDGERKDKERSYQSPTAPPLTRGRLRDHGKLKPAVPSRRRPCKLSSNPDRFGKPRRVCPTILKKEGRSCVTEVTAEILSALNGGRRHAVAEERAHVRRGKVQLRGKSKGSRVTEGDGRIPRRSVICRVQKGNRTEPSSAQRECRWSRDVVESVPVPGRVKLKEGTSRNEHTRRRPGEEDGPCLTKHRARGETVASSAVGRSLRRRPTAEDQEHRPRASRGFFGSDVARRAPSRQRGHSLQTGHTKHSYTPIPDDGSDEELLKFLRSSELPLSPSRPGIRLLPSSLTRKDAFKRFTGLIDLTALSHITAGTQVRGTDSGNNVAVKHTSSVDELSHQTAASPELREDPRVSPPPRSSSGETGKERDEFADRHKSFVAKAALDRAEEDGQPEYTTNANSAEETTSTRSPAAQAESGTGVGSAASGVGGTDHEARKRWANETATPHFDREGFEAIGIKNPALLLALKSAAIAGPTQIQRLTASRLLLGSHSVACRFCQGAVFPDGAPFPVSDDSASGNAGSPTLHLSGPFGRPFRGRRPLSAALDAGAVSHPFLTECGEVGPSVFLVEASTGSGKTLAYLLPLLQRLLEHTRAFPRRSAAPSVEALILAPGRELAAQIYSVCRTLVKSVSTSGAGLDRKKCEPSSSFPGISWSRDSLRSGEDGTAAPTPRGDDEECAQLASEGSCLTASTEPIASSFSPFSPQEERATTLAAKSSAVDGDRIGTVACACSGVCSCNSLLRPFLLVGGANASRQIERLRKHRPNIVVATPGRLASFLTSPRGRVRRLVSLRACSFVVLDEGDALLETEESGAAPNVTRELRQEGSTIGGIVGVNTQHSLTSSLPANPESDDLVKGHDADRGGSMGGRELESETTEGAKKIEGRQISTEPGTGRGEISGSVYLSEPLCKGNALYRSTVATRREKKEAARRRRLVWQMRERLRLLQEKWERRARFTLWKERQATGAQQARLLQMLKGEGERPESEEEKDNHSRKGGDVLRSVLNTVKEGKQNRMSYKQQEENLEKERIKHLAELRQRLQRQLMAQLSKPVLRKGRQSTLADVQTILKFLWKQWGSKRARSQDEESAKDGGFAGKAHCEKRHSSASEKAETEEKRESDHTVHPERSQATCSAFPVSSLCSSGAPQPAFPFPSAVSPFSSSPRQLLLVSATATRLRPPSIREKLLLSGRACIEVIRSSSLWGEPGVSLPNPSDSREQKAGGNREEFLVGQQADLQDNRPLFKEISARLPDNVIHMFVESANDDILRNFKKFLKAEPLDKRILVFCNKQVRHLSLSTVVWSGETGKPVICCVWLACIGIDYFDFPSRGRPVFLNSRKELYSPAAEKGANTDGVRQLHLLSFVSVASRFLGVSQKSAAWLEAWMRDTEPAIETALLNGWLSKTQRRSRLRQLLYGRPSLVSRREGKPNHDGEQGPERGTRFMWISTEVGARGLDFANVDMAVNLQLPTGKLKLKRFS